MMKHKIALVFTVAIVTLTLVSGAFANFHPSQSQCQLAWEQLSSPNVGALTAIEPIQRDNVWVGGIEGILHWDGKEWMQVSIPINATISSFSALSPTDIWAVGRELIDSTVNQSVILHWDGDKWETVSHPDVGTLSDIQALDTNNIWAVGLQILHWNGETWSIVPTPSQEGIVFSYNAVSFSSPEVGWAVGSQSPQSGPNIFTSTWILKWDGSSWDKGISPIGSPAAFLTDVAALTASDAWAVGGAASHPVSLHWNGQEWTQIENSKGIALKAFATDDIFSVGNKTISHWDGRNWLDIATLDADLYDIAGFSPDDLWVVGAIPGDLGNESYISHGTVASNCEPTPTPPSSACLIPPILKSPQNDAVVSTNIVTLKWKAVDCAKNYEVLLRKSTSNGDLIERTRVKAIKYSTSSLAWNSTYSWSVRSCIGLICGRKANWRQFSLGVPKRSDPLSLADNVASYCHSGLCYSIILPPLASLFQRLDD